MLALKLEVTAHKSFQILFDLIKQNVITSVCS